MIERVIERRLVSEVSRLGGLALKLSVVGWAGIPDRLVLLGGGKLAFVELKASGQKLRPLQVKRAEQLRALGFEVWCIDSIEGVLEFINGR